MSDGGSADAEPIEIPDGARPDGVRFNQIQVRGTVNSYHDFINGGLIPEAQYRHVAIDRQAAEQGIRQFDFDLSADRFAGLVLEPKNAESFLDNANHCGDWYGCLWELRDWSDAHPGHPMVVVLVGESLINLDLMPHLHHQLDDLERVIIDRLGRDRVYSPADLRRGFPSLREAIDARGWPTIDETRGRVLFVLKDRGMPRTEYIVNGGLDPTDRLLFIAGDPGLVDDPALGDEVVFTFEPEWAWDYESDREALPTMRALVEAGMLVHATTDDPEFAAELREAGVHMIGTRFPAMLGPVIEQPIVCNLATRPEGCAAPELDPR